MVCLNCSTKIVGHYCYECGQKSEDLRFTIKGLLKDLFFSAFHLEKRGLPNTIMRLTREPGVAIREVLDGKRQSLYPPFKYLVLVGAIVIICSLRYRFFHNEYTQVQTNDMHALSAWVPMEYEAFVEDFFKFAEDKATLLNVVAIPIFAFFSFAWLSGRRYNFAENLILNTYITGQQLVFLVLLIPFYEFFPESKTLIIAVYTVAIVLYNIWVYMQFYGKKLSIGVKSLAVVLFAYVYQFPVNFLIFYIYDLFLHDHMHWLPEVYENIVG